MMKDRYGRIFISEEIKNYNDIGFIESKPLAEYSKEEISKNIVLIKSPVNGSKLYLYEDLKHILKANHYCRLEDPFTREDILNQVPEFHVVLDLERNAAHYNAYILNKHPNFISLLNIYVQEVLNTKDLIADAGLNRNLIKANKSAELNLFYENITNFTDDERRDFFSLFITNRSAMYLTQLRSWILPAKWDKPVTDYQELSAYNKSKSQKIYTDFPHRNVLMRDLIADPERACMHTWGMEVLHLLLEYHIGRNIPYKIPVGTDLHDLQLRLSAQIQKKLTPGSLNIVRGRDSFVQVQALFIDKRIAKLKQKCVGYLDHILDTMKIQKQGIYPIFKLLHHDNTILLEKYQAVHELYETLIANTPGINDEECLNKFAHLFNQKERQKTIAGHRDSMGVRFLNVVISTLSLGLKNLFSYVQTDGYWGFWHSRGSYLNKALSEITRELTCLP